MAALTIQARGLVGRAVSWGSRLNPVSVSRRRMRLRQRAAAERKLIELSRSGGRAPIAQTVLIDAMWDNPHYWLRYALVRAALGLASSREVGILGPYSARACRKTLERFGISTIENMVNLWRRATPELLTEARRLVSSWKGPDDVLRWKLPRGIPADFIYDGILKRQRAASIRLEDPRLVEYVAEVLGGIRAAEQLLDRHQPELLVLSHAINFYHVALIILAVQRSIPSVVLYGHFVVAQFVKIRQPQELYATLNCPTRAQIESLSEERAAALAAAGMAYLARRLGGQTPDIGAFQAYRQRTGRVTRQALCEQFGWDPSVPIVGVYVPTWFDFPHTYGMRHFRDTLDWFQSTLAVAARHRRVHWLFKAHPCEEFYGGVTLHELQPLRQERHVQFAAQDWNGSAFLEALDGIVTYYGMIGVEAAAMGKPVLSADRGWYHEVGFVKWAASREEYLETLTRPWWKELDLADTTPRAQIFAGWFFGRPAWQAGFVLQDDSKQDALYETMPQVLQEHAQVIAREIALLRAWFETDNRHYHTYKMALAEAVVG